LATYQKKKVLADPSLPSDFRLLLAQSLRHNLFLQANPQSH
jgi:hypothetical protein